MITPRRTRLLRVPSLRALQGALIDAVAALDPLAAADTFIVVPTRAAGEQLRRTVEDRLLATRPSLAWPGVGPRADLYRALLARVPRPRRLLSPFDREVIIGRLARETAAAGLEPPFALRPALVAEVVALYDYIRRQARTVEDFDRNLRAELEPAAETDRGAAQLLRQTDFLSAVFRGYEAQLADAPHLDEHGARACLLAEEAAQPLRHVILTVGDRVGDPDGLWPVDFTLLSALPRLERVDVVATEAALSAGFLERVHAVLPELEEVPSTALDPSRPVLVVPDRDGPGVHHARDREEELAAVARRVKAARRAGDQTPLHRRALVVRRPLPYLYLARSVFGGAGVSFETLDTLPLAAEPFAAALDLVLDIAISGGSRVSLVALLSSPHFRFEDGGAPLPPATVVALDRALADARYLGGVDRLADLARQWSVLEAPASVTERRQQVAAAAARAALAAMRHLAPLAEPGPAAAQIGVLRQFLDDHDAEPAGGTDPTRLARVRRAVTGALAALARAYATHDPTAPVTAQELSSAIRRWLGAQTFATRSGEAGLRLLDAQAARFADVDDVQLLGLVEGEWPEAARRNVLYPSFLLLPLEPTPAADDPNRRDSLALAAARAAFTDLLGLARREVRVSTFALESDAVVEPSPFVDDLPAAAIERQVSPPPAALAVFVDEALTAEPPRVDLLRGPAAAWAALRVDRLAPGDPRVSGEAGPWPFPRISVSRVDRYLKCPFQFFASEVLGLEEEPEDEEAPPPWERGRFLHALFEAFFREWQRRGHGRIGAETIADARALLLDLADRALASLPPTEAALERTRLLGSAAGAGIIDRVLAMEAERPTPIDRRLLEYELDDAFRFRRADGSTTVVPLRAKVDRIDLLADGTFRVIDYKSRVVPEFKRSVQLQVYTSAVMQQLGRDRRSARLPAEAAYLSMEGDRPVKALRPGRGESLDDLLAAAEDRMLSVIDNARAGHFPPRPSPRSACGSCPFGAVCRKAFVEAEDE